MKTSFALVAGALVLIAATTQLLADGSAHPYYLQALSDLHAAKWNIEHCPSSSKTADDKEKAANEINAEISAINRAAINDGKDIQDHQKADEALDAQGHLHRALDLLEKTRMSLSHEQDDSTTRGLRKASFLHLCKAIRFLGKSLLVAGHHNGR